MRQINKKYLLIACENCLMLLDIYSFSIDTKITIPPSKNIEIFGKMNDGIWLLGERNYNYFVFREKNFSIKEIGIPKIDCLYYISCLYPKVVVDYFFNNRKNYFIYQPFNHEIDEDDFDFSNLF